MTDVFSDLDEQQQQQQAAQPTLPAPAVDPFADLDLAAKANAFPPVGPDKYQQAAIDDRNKLIAAGAPVGPSVFGHVGSVSDLAGYGASMGWGPQLFAGLLTPAEMIRQGTVNPAEAFKYALARENLTHQKELQETNPQIASAAQFLGGMATGVGTIGAGTRAAAARIPLTQTQVPATVVNALQNIGKGAGLGAFGGASQGDTLMERGRNMVMGGLFGGALGGTVPLLSYGFGKTASAFQLPRLQDPEDVATAHLADTTRAAGVFPTDIPKELANAQAVGQPYTVADVLGTEGQRKLAGLAKLPGAPQQLIYDTMGARDVNMPNRVVDQVTAALQAQGTAAQASKSLTEKAAADAGPLYRQAEQNPSWSPGVQEFLAHPDIQSGLKEGLKLQELRALGTGQPFDPHDYAITSFNEAGDPVIGAVPNLKTLQAAKVGLDAMIGRESNPVTGRLTARGEALAGVKSRLLAQIDAVNPTYGEARQAYAGPMEVNDAVRAGQEMATRGRWQDTTQSFNALPPYAQQGVRIGYADAALTPLERSGNYPGLLRAKSVKGSNELDALSLLQGPDQPGMPSQLRTRLNREETMLKTSNATVGGSSTAGNIADMSGAPGGEQLMGLATAAASHNPVGMARVGVDILKRFGTGESEAQRMAITRALLETDPDKAAQMAQRIQDYELTRRGLNPTSPWSAVRAPRIPIGQ